MQGWQRTGNTEHEDSRYPSLSRLSAGSVDAAAVWCQKSGQAVPTEVTAERSGSPSNALAHRRLARRERRTNVCFRERRLSMRFRRFVSVELLFVPAQSRDARIQVS